MARPILSIENVTMRYEQEDGTSLLALEDVSLEVNQGEFISIVGPSGCGKTSLLEIIAGLRQLTKGVVSVEGQSTDDPRARRRIGVVFQEDTLFPWRTVLSNTAFALEMRGVAAEERKARAHGILQLMGLAQFAHHHPWELSGGMRQRVAVARTLVAEPDILLLDEPFGALDAQTRLVLGTEISQILHQLGSTVVLVTHSIEEAALLSDRVYVLTARPGRAKTVITASLDHPRGIRWEGSSELASLTKEIWENLKTEVSPGGTGVDSQVNHDP